MVLFHFREVFVSSYRPPESVLWLTLMTAINELSFGSKRIDPGLPVPEGCSVPGCAPPAPGDAAARAPRADPGLCPGHETSASSEPLRADGKGQQSCSLTQATSVQFSDLWPSSLTDHLPCSPEILTFGVCWSENLALSAS